MARCRGLFLSLSLESLLGLVSELAVVVLVRVEEQRVFTGSPLEASPTTKVRPFTPPLTSIDPILTGPAFSRVRSGTLKRFPNLSTPYNMSLGSKSSATISSMPSGPTVSALTCDDVRSNLIKSAPLAPYSAFSDGRYARLDMCSVNEATGVKSNPSGPSLMVTKLYVSAACAVSMSSVVKCTP